MGSDQHGTIAPTSDLELVRRAQDGDRDALDELLGRHYDAISTRCRRIAGNAADGDDATQEALLAIVRGLARFDGRAAFSTWAYRVATNACLDELRRRGRRPVPVEEDPEPAPPSGPTDRIGDELGQRDEIRSAHAHLMTQVNRR